MGEANQQKERRDRTRRIAEELIREVDIGMTVKFPEDGMRKSYVFYNSLLVVLEGMSLHTGGMRSKEMAVAVGYLMTDVFSGIAQATSLEYAENLRKGVLEHLARQDLTGNSNIAGFSKDAVAEHFKPKKDAG